MTTRVFSGDAELILSGTVQSFLGSKICVQNDDPQMELTFELSERQDQPNASFRFDSDRERASVHLTIYNPTGRFSLGTHLPIPIGTVELDDGTEKRLYFHFRSLNLIEKITDDLVIFYAIYASKIVPELERII